MIPDKYVYNIYIASEEIVLYIASCFSLNQENLRYKLLML